MRPVLALLLLAALAVPQERKHDELGFPITFNDERITRNDVVRSIVAPGAQTTPGNIQARRDQILMEKLTQRIAELWAIKVHPLELDAIIRRQIETRGGEAAFYDHLRQNGLTLAQFEEQTRLKILWGNINFLLVHGITPPPTRKVLPWAVKPTPEEIRIAFRNDKRRARKRGRRVKRIVLTLELSNKEKVAILLKHQDDVGKATELVAQKTKELADEVVAKLKGGKTFLDVAQEHGGDGIEGQLKEWHKIPDKESRDPVVRFCQTAKEKTYSAPILQQGPLYLVVYLAERQDEKERGLDDAAVQVDYFNRIQTLRRERALALMRLRALDKSLLRPDFVRKGFREIIVSDLRAAVEELRELGLN